MSSAHPLHFCFISMEAYATLCPGVAAEAGGAGFQLVQIAQVLRDRGHPVSFVVGDYGQPFHKQLQGFDIWRANQVAHDRSYQRALLNLGRLWRAMRAAKADVYVLRSTRFLNGQCWLFSRALGARYGFMVANRSNCLADDREGVPGILNTLHAKALAGADLVTAQTMDQQVLIRREFGVDPPVVPNGITTGEAVPGAEDREFDVLWVGSLKPVKQPHVLAELASRMPHRSFAVVGGAGEDQAYHQQVVEQLTSLPNVTVAGFVPPDEVGSWYARSRLFLNTSLHEGYPNTFLYSWTRGTPVCSLLVDPDGEVAGQGLGLVDEDMDQLVMGMENLLVDEDAWSQCSRRCCQWVAQAHGVETTANRFLAAWDEVLP